MPTNTKKHRYLVAGEVHFLPIVDGEVITNAPQASKLNAVITSDSKRLGVREIGRAQQALQMNHHKQMDDPSMYQIFDVFIINLVYLGISSDEEFQNSNVKQTDETRITLPMLSPDTQH